MKTNLDLYDLRARRCPALLVLLPIVLGLLAWFPDRFAGWGVLTAVIGAAGGCLLLSQLARDQGKRKESALFQLWGGSPTTRRLRHRHSGLDWITLARYHTFLGRQVGIAAPTKAEEAAEPFAADQVYEAFTQYMREATRDKEKFPLVFAENVNYGFRRNLWGMKPAAIVITIIAAVASMLPLAMAAYTGDKLPITAAVSSVVCIVLLVWWALRVNPAWVQIAAEAYAERLLGACTPLSDGQLTAAAKIARGQ